MSETTADMAKRMLALTTFPIRDQQIPPRTHLIIPAPDSKLWSCCVNTSQNGETTIQLELWRGVDSKGEMRGLEYGFVAWPDNVVGPCYRD